MARRTSSTSFLRDTVTAIGQSYDQKDIDAGYRIVRKRKLDELDTEKRFYLQRNIPISTDVDLGRSKEVQRAKTHGHREVIHLEENTEDIDILFEYKDFDGVLNLYNKEHFERAIPHFERLYEKTMTLLPQYVFRVVHAESAGAVVQEGDSTWFLSHGSAEERASEQDGFTGPITNFDVFDRDEIADQLKCHISGWKSSGGRQFSSRWISTTDSFEAALNRAERYTSKKFGNVSIYIIDTNTLQKATLTILIFLAMKAYDVSPNIAGWKVDMFRYNSLTEWVFWDQIRASDVVKIDYNAFARPARSLKKGWRLHLQDVLPEVIKAGSFPEGSSRGIPRTVLHANTYHSQDELSEIEHFEEKVFAKRTGPLPRASKVAKSDRRSAIDDAYIESIWYLAGDTKHKGVLFLWILSVMTKKSYVDNLVDAVVRLYPDVVLQQLHRVFKDDDNLQSESLLVHYMPGPNCFGRVDINNYQKLVRKCVERWTFERIYCQDSLGDKPDIYIVAGVARPVRNLVKLEQTGLKGACRSIPLLEKTFTSIEHQTYQEVKRTGHRVVFETDAEYHDRHRTTYGPIFHAPNNISSSLTARVSNNAAWNHVTCSSVFTTECSAAPCEREHITTAERRLRLKQVAAPPAVGEAIAAIGSRSSRDSTKSEA